MRRAEAEPADPDAPPAEMADVRLADVTGDWVRDDGLRRLQAEGYQVCMHWSGEPGLSAADAWRLRRTRERQRAELEAETAATVAAQQAWLTDRANAFRTAANSDQPEGRTRLRTPEQAAAARERGIRAMIRWERAHPPEAVGFNPSVRTDPGMINVAEPEPVAEFVQ